MPLASNSSGQTLVASLFTLRIHQVEFSNQQPFRAIPICFWSRTSKGLGMSLEFAVYPERLGLCKNVSSCGLTQSHTMSTLNILSAVSAPCVTRSNEGRIWFRIESNFSHEYDYTDFFTNFGAFRHSAKQNSLNFQRNPYIRSFVNNFFWG